MTAQAPWSCRCAHHSQASHDRHVASIGQATTAIPARSSLAAVRNPLLALPAMAALQALPADQRAALAALLHDVRRDAHAKADKAWLQHKGPMAAYWRAVGVYAGHTARALR